MDDSEAQRPSLGVHWVPIRRAGDDIDLPAFGAHHAEAVAYDAFVDKPRHLPQPPPCRPLSRLVATFTLEEFCPKYNMIGLNHPFNS